jgi:hypothetical protein
MSGSLKIRPIAGHLMGNAGGISPVAAPLASLALRRSGLIIVDGPYLILPKFDS